MNEIVVDTRGGPTSGPFYEDADGFNMPLAPGTSNRRIPRGDFPTGPEVGLQLPDIVATDQSGRRLDVHADRDGRRAVVVFTRSAVW
ncbi:MAG: hypothetical protein ACR2QO_06515 [Acidimicrobiales bacterium]